MAEFRLPRQAVVDIAGAGAHVAQPPVADLGVWVALPVLQVPPRRLTAAGGDDGEHPVVPQAQLEEDGTFRACNAAAAGQVTTTPAP